MSTANSHQVGGKHYKTDVEHWDFIEKNQIGYLEGCATKYVSRWKKKGGVQDLEKALHYIQKTLELFRAGFKRPPRCLTVVPLVDFVTANDLDTLETQAVSLIAFWRDDKDLIEAQEVIKELIKDARRSIEASLDIV